MSNVYKDTKYVSLHFEGYFACRIATDPDPTDEKRGMSGYTMALSTEDNLDQVIRLNVSEEYLDKNLRQPGPLINMDANLKRGVVVTEVMYDGQSLESDYVGASLNLRGENKPFKGPIFESRNNITGSDDTMAFVITPFELEILEKVEKTEAPRRLIYAVDDLNPEGAINEQKIWAINNPSIYGRRLPVNFEADSEEVKKAINVFDQYGYFRDRKRFLQDEINRLSELNDDLVELVTAVKEKLKSTKDKKKQATLKAQQTNYEREIKAHEIIIEQNKSRIHQIDFWGIRVTNKLGFKLTWAFNINGTKQLNEPFQIEGDKGKEVLIPFPNWDWPITFWFGGWDGDLLTGFMRGVLKIPVERKLPE